MPEAPCDMSVVSREQHTGPCAAAAAGRLGRIVAAVVLVSTATSCVDDSFQNPLSDTASSRPEPRLIGTWDLVADGESRRLALTSDPKVAGRLLLSVPGGEFVAQSLTLDGHRFLLVLPSEKTQPRRGWLVGYEHSEKGPPRVRLIDRTTTSQAIEAEEAEGSLLDHYTSWFLWRIKITDPVLSLDSAQTRRWLGTHPGKVPGPSKPFLTQLERVLDEPMNAEIDPEGDLATNPEPCDEALIGETYDGPSDARFIVETTDDPAVLAWSMMDAPDFDKPQPQRLLVTEIDGVSYLTAMGGMVPMSGDDGAAEHLIFRFEFIDDDMLALIAPEDRYLDAVVREKVLSAKVREPRPWQDDADWLVTSSTEQLREFVAERGADFFPDRLRAKMVLYFRRADDQPK